MDLFCGVGGLTHGLKQAGFKGFVGVDADASCKYAYERNNDGTFKCLDVSNTSAETIAGLFPDRRFRALVGCAPCQPFSSYNKSGPGSQWRLVEDFGRIVVGAAPDVASMENVPALVRHPVFERLVATLRDAGYTVWFDVVNSAAYGAAQRRRRLVLMASLHGEIQLIAPSGTVAKTVRQTISGLPALEAGGVDPSDPLHRCAGLTSINLKRVRSTPTGGDWRDWPEELRLPCHKRETGLSYPSVYGRLGWDDVAPTLTTQFHTLGTGRWGHPEQDRAISLREGALLQGFPRDYEFVEATSQVKIGTVARHIGNAVPVALGRAIGDSLLLHLRGLDDE